MIRCRSCQVCDSNPGQSRTTSDSLYAMVAHAVCTQSFSMPGCGFALPGHLLPGQGSIRYLLRLNDRKQAVSPKCSHAVRGSRVYRKRICSTEVSALRRPPGACGRDAACAGCFRCFCPAAAFARKIHNRQLCLISCGAVPDSALLLNITAHYGIPAVWVVSRFSVPGSKLPLAEHYRLHTAAP